MKVQCVLCDGYHTLDPHSLQAKRLRNRWIQMFLCKSCDERIRSKTLARHATGNFHLYNEDLRKDELI
ncbi:MAG TPA: YlaI family protein [Bacillota bacterium]|nr:YlaI family protein [Bacillota bacterium]